MMAEKIVSVFGRKPAAATFLFRLEIDPNEWSSE
jgi:hypothetical protein